MSILININHRPQIVPSNTQDVEGSNNVATSQNAQAKGVSKAPPPVMENANLRPSGGIPTQIRDVVPQPLGVFDAQALSAALSKLDGAPQTSLVGQPAQNPVNVGELLAPFLSLREQVEGGQGNPQLVNWMRDLDVNTGDVSALNASVLQTPLMKVLDGPKLQAAFDELADKMAEALEAKGMDPLEAGAIAMASSQIHMTSMLVGAVFGVPGGADLQQDIADQLNALEGRLADLLQNKG